MLLKGIIIANINGVCFSADHVVRAAAAAAATTTRQNYQTHNGDAVVGWLLLRSVERSRISHLSILISTEPAKLCPAVVLHTTQQQKTFKLHTLSQIQTKKNIIYLFGAILCFGLWSQWDH